MFLIDAFLMKISGWLGEGRERTRRFVINAELSARGFFEAFFPRAAFSTAGRIIPPHRFDVKREFNKTTTRCWLSQTLFSYEAVKMRKCETSSNIFALSLSFYALRKTIHGLIIVKSFLG